MSGVAVVVPYPGRGHINPMMLLATKLASHGVSVTFVITEAWYKIITQGEDDFFSDATNLGLDIRAGLIPDCVVGESERSVNFTAFILSLSNMESHVINLISNLNSSGVKPSCIVADTLLNWAAPLARRLDLISVALWTGSVTGFCFFDHLNLVGMEACKVDHILGVSSFVRAEFLELTLPSPVNDWISKCLTNVRDADSVVVNSFEALDSNPVEALRQKIPVQCVGPLNMPFAGGRNQKRVSQCRPWLDSKPARSVIYVSFGSFINVGRAQVGEIALGLMQSGYSFVWALRPDSDASHVREMLPPGFLEECKDRGLIKPWFNQEEILSHPSVGGFFSHCGWNAVLESISAGVPILGFPLGMDQYYNCTLAVEEWKFALRGRNKEDEKRIIGAQEIAGKVKMLMEGEESVRLRGAVERFREAATEEVIYGMSASNLKLLADRVKASKTAMKEVTEYQVIRDE